MKKLWQLTIPVVALFLLLASMTALSWIQDLHEVQPDHEPWLLVGHVHCLLITPDFWGRFPAVPRPAFLYSAESLAMSLMLAGLVVYLLGIRARRPLSIIAVGCLLACVVPWLVGLAILRGNTVPSNTGPGLLIMLMPVVHLSFMAICLTTYDLVKKPSHKCRACPPCKPGQLVQP